MKETLVYMLTFIYKDYCIGFLVVQLSASGAPVPLFFCYCDSWTEVGIIKREMSAEQTNWLCSKSNWCGNWRLFKIYSESVFSSDFQHERIVQNCLTGHYHVITTAAKEELPFDKHGVLYIVQMSVCLPATWWIAGPILPKAGGVNTKWRDSWNMNQTVCCEGQT